MLYYSVKLNAAFVKNKYGRVFVFGQPENSAENGRGNNINDGVYGYES